MIKGDFVKEEYDRKTMRFNTKNKLHFDEATNNLKEVLRIFNGEITNWLDFTVEY